MAASALAGLVMAAIIVVPQIIVAVAAPWVGHYAEQWGRKPMLLVRFGLEPLRGVLFALGASSYSIIAVQILDGIRGAIITVMTVLVMTDLTTGTGRFNLAQGAVGTCTGVAAAVSTTATGVIRRWVRPTRQLSDCRSCRRARRPTVVAVLTGKQAERVSRLRSGLKGTAAFGASFPFLLAPVEVG